MASSRRLLPGVGLVLVLGILFLTGCRGLVAGSGSGSGIQLTATSAVPGTGAVTSNPSGINCPGTCTATFAQGNKVTLTAIPDAGFVFSGWSGACSGTVGCTISLDASATATAKFGTTTLQSINHIIFMVQENRGLDHYFGAMREYWAANGIPDQPFDGLPPVQ